MMFKQVFFDDFESMCGLHPQMWIFVGQFCLNTERYQEEKLKYLRKIVMALSKREKPLKLIDSQS